MIDSNAVLALLGDVNALQHIDRTGYKIAGIPQPESVAEHSYSVIWFALIIAEAEGANIDKVLKMALLHDLPEARTGDSTQPFVEKYLGETTKQAVEQSVLTDQLRLLPVELQTTFQQLWEELSRGLSLEAKVVHDADKLQMMHRITLYEQTYTTDFSAFWHYADVRDWLPTSSTLYRALPRSRNK